MRRPLTGTTVALTALAVGLALAPVSPAAADHERLPQGRHLKDYTVRSGDTVTGLAVRFHAWTAEIVSHNHLDGAGGLRVGERIEIPVVKAGSGTKGGDKGRTSKMWQHPDRDREKVRRVIAGAARNHGVDPQLALAISWQESGWQMGVVSGAHAIGAMQVLPATGAWMSMYTGRRLHIRRLHDNVLAGVILLDVLDDLTRTRRRMIGAYYQGLGAVREHGLYSETRRYVRNVLAIEHRLERGLPPS